MASDERKSLIINIFYMYTCIISFFENCCKAGWKTHFDNHKIFLSLKYEVPYRLQWLTEIAVSCVHQILKTDSFNIKTNVQLKIQIID